LAQRIRIKELESPIGSLLLAHSDAGLCAIRLPAGDIDQARGKLRKSLEKRFGPVELTRDEDGLLEKAIRFLKVYFNAPEASTSFSGALDPGGTAFQQLVWNELKRIRAGTVLSYGEVARRIGRPQAARAVGTACGANPLAIIIPCHRVVGSGGGLGGFGGGLGLKKRLLKAEGREIKS
jgi:O-6-methylguanine DNA methyltransferase